MPKVAHLYNYFKPEHYRLIIEPNLKKMAFSGKVTIVGSFIKSSTKLRLHAKDLVIHKVLVAEQELKFSVNSDNDELTIVLPRLQSEFIEITIHFKSKITKPMHGLYPSIGRDGGIVLATQFESHHAREVFPCIDEPQAKATFDLTLITPDKETVLANTPVKTSSSQGGLTTTEFETTPIMSTYLLAFAIGNIIANEATTKTGVVVRAWATPDQAAFTNFSLEVATKTLDFFNEYFEIPYPLDKCDLIALPDFASGAMENWGLITFRETCMLVDPANTSLATKQYVAMVVAHEVAHQWFGNLVTMEWWTDLWLNEGFASWIEYMAVDKLFPQWHMWTQFIADEQQAALRLDALKNTHPVEVEVRHPDEIRTIFDTISYAKGSSVIHMLHAYLGAENFRKGLVYYLKKHAYGNATTLDLWAALAHVSKKPVEKFMTAWTSEPGFPIVKLREEDQNTVKISQKRFLTSPDERNTSTVWNVPLLTNDIKNSTLTEQNAVFKIYLDKSYKINRGQAGFYLTKYPKKHYAVLGQEILNQRLPEVDRLGILADALALNKAGNLQLAQLLTLLSYYSNEDSAPVWDIIASLIGDIRRVMNEEVREAIKPLVILLTKNQVARLGWQESPSESHFDRLLRPTILGLAASAENPAVLKHANMLFTKAKRIEDLPANIRSVILASVSRHGNARTYSKVLGFYKETNNPEDKVALAAALTNFRTKTEFNKTLKLIKSKDVRLQDVGYWVAYSLSNPFGRQMAWEWLKGSWEWLEDNLGADLSFSRIPMYVARVYSDKKFLIEFEKFFADKHSPSLERAIKQGIETIKTQTAWRERDEQALLTWLTHQE